MFTGIVEELARVQSISKRPNSTLLAVKANRVLADVNIGDSVAVNGVCLTVVKKERQVLLFEAIPQTLRMTNLSNLKVSEQVNLERSLKVGDRLSGHFVSGHIDCTGTIRKKNHIRQEINLAISIPKEFIKYCIPRGSIAIDGISLTLAEVKSNTFTVYIIPYTLKNTTLAFKGPSSKVNIEFDILAKSSALN
jgi:riboflavin synthase